jgi:DNA polymerase-2
MSETVAGFLLHVFQRQQQDNTVTCAVGRLENGQTFAFYDDREQPGFYVRAADLEAVRQLAVVEGIVFAEGKWSTMDGEAAVRVSAGRPAVLRKLRQRLEQQIIRTYEADLNHSLHYLINRGLRGSVGIGGAWRAGEGIDRVYNNPHLEPSAWEPELVVLALDIETDIETDEVFAVALVSTGPGEGQQLEEIHLVGEEREDDPGHLFCHADEKIFLQALNARVRQIDPDVLSGWNVIDFDLTVLERRCKVHGVDFNLGRTRDSSWYREGKTWGGSRMVVYGRQVLDALHLIRATLQRFDDYRLDTVARGILGRGKTLEADEETSMPEVIVRAYQEDRSAFCEYCLEDSRLVRDILQKEGLIELTLRRSLLTGLPLERAWGSVAAFDSIYIGALHRQGLVAPSVGVDRNEGRGAPGGLIIAPEVGLYHNIFVFDFKSLYPSIMRTFNIDPLSHIRGKQQAGAAADLIAAPNGAVFAREPAILPDVLERLFERREQAKADDDALASYTYKIIMNSFYGVLATGACRFADDQLAGAITEFGHYFLNWTKELLQGEGVQVLYGDTDSLFVDAGLEDDVELEVGWARGEELCAWANGALTQHIESSYGVQSHLDLEFEKYYRRFLLPPMRGSDRGRAKGYAGLRLGAGTEFVEVIGMEAVRRDWTDMAHQIQRELLALLFRDTPPEQIEDHIFAWVCAVRAGEKDADLVYRKSLRKAVEAYTRSTPPHVKAARLLPNPRGVIHYVVTRDGPQPVGHISSPVDYDHYVEKQIEPIVRTIAQVYPIDADAALKGERNLFHQFT